MPKQNIKSAEEEYLYQAWHIETNIASCINEMNAIRLKLYSVPISSYGNVVRGINPVNTTEDYISDLIEYEDKLKVLISEYSRLKKEIQEIIERVPNMRERTVLRLRFIERMSFNDIGIAMSYSKSQVFEFYDQAIKNVKIPQSSE